MSQYFMCTLTQGYTSMKWPPCFMFKLRVGRGCRDGAADDALTEREAWRRLRLHPSVGGSTHPPISL